MSAAEFWVERLDKGELTDELVERLCEIEKKCFTLPWSKAALVSELALPFAKFFLLRRQEANGASAHYKTEENGADETSPQGSAAAINPDGDRDGLAPAAAEIIGYASCRQLFDEGEIMNVAVLPCRQGQGGGRALLDALLLDAEADGIRRITLEVRVGNAAALAVYHRAGFVVCGQRKAYYSDNGEDAHIMFLDLGR